MFANFGQHGIFHGSCLDLLRLQENNSCTTVVADWPFTIYKDLLPQVVKESSRVLEEGGSFLSVLYPDENYYVRKECENKGFAFADDISLKMKVCYVIDENKLPRRSLSILAMIKGSLDKRKWNVNTSNYPSLMFSSEAFDAPTTCWFDKEFKNGYKKGDIKHSEAMPKWTVDKMVDNLIPKDGSVLDLFGGAGTVLQRCMERNIPCISSEIKEHNCSIIRDRILSI